VNSKEPFGLEESEYASLWIRSDTRICVFTLREKNSKKKTRSPEELPLSPPPYILPTPSPDPTPPPSSPPSAPVPDHASPPPSPIIQNSSSTPPNSPRENKRVTRSHAKRMEQLKEELYPLREIAMGGPQPGMGFVSVPLSSGNVREFKKEMGNLLEDPLGVSERLDQFLGPNVYAWEELQAILGMLFTMEDREMIRRAGMRVWDQQHQQCPGGDIKWPLQRPNWDNQNAEHRTHMADLRTIIVQGIRESVPRGQNINKAFSEHQKKDETPTEWLERLWKNLQLYSGLDPATPVGQALLKTQFVAKSWVVIRRKLEKLEDWQEKGLDELLREAQKVYVRREEETQKKQARILVAAIQEGQKVAPTRTGGAGVSRPREIPPGDQGDLRDMRQVECFYCQRKGHMSCRKRIRDEQMFKED